LFYITVGEKPDEFHTGISSAEEMCIAFLYYHPRQTFDTGQGLNFSWYCGFDMLFPQCEATHEERALHSHEEIHREFAIPNP
jgi:hypothetical protein